MILTKLISFAMAEGLLLERKGGMLCHELLKMSRLNGKTGAEVKDFRLDAMY